MIVDDAGKLPRTSFSREGVRLVPLWMGDLRLHASVPEELLQGPSGGDIARLFAPHARIADFSGYYEFGRDERASVEPVDAASTPLEGTGSAMDVGHRAQAPLPPFAAGGRHAWPWPRKLSPFVLLAHASSEALSLVIDGEVTPVADWALGAWMRRLPGLLIGVRALENPVVLLGCQAAGTLQRVADQTGRLGWAPTGVASLRVEPVDQSIPDAGERVLFGLGPAQGGRTGSFRSAFPRGSPGDRVRWAYRERFGPNDPRWLAERFAEPGASVSPKARPLTLAGAHGGRIHGLAYFDERDRSSRPLASNVGGLRSDYAAWTLNDTYRPGTPRDIDLLTGALDQTSEPWHTRELGPVPVDLGSTLVVAGYFADARFLVPDVTTGLSHWEEPADFGRRIRRDFEAAAGGRHGTQPEMPRMVLLLTDFAPVTGAAAVEVARGLDGVETVTVSAPATLFLDDRPGIGVPPLRLALLPRQAVDEPIWMRSNGEESSVLRTRSDLAAIARNFEPVRGPVDLRDLLHVRRSLEGGAAVVGAAALGASAAPVLHRGVSDGKRVIGADLSTDQRSGGWHSVLGNLRPGRAFRMLEVNGEYGTPESGRRAAWPMLEGEYRALPFDVAQDPFFVFVDHYGGFFPVLAESAHGEQPSTRLDSPAQLGDRIKSLLAEYPAHPTYAGGPATRPVVLLAGHRPLEPHVVTAVAARLSGLDVEVFAASMPAAAYRRPGLDEAMGALALIRLPGDGGEPEWMKMAPSGTFALLAAPVVDSAGHAATADSAAASEPAAPGRSPNSTADPDGQARETEPEATPRVGPGARDPEQYNAPPVPDAILRWGDALGGMLGLVHLDPLPEDTLAALRLELAAAVRTAADDPGPLPAGISDLEARLKNYVDAAWLEERLPYLRSVRGDRVVVQHRGRQYAVWLRLALVDPAPSTGVPHHDPSQDAQRPLLKLEKRSVAATEFRDNASTTNYRSFSIPGLPSWRIASGVVSGVSFTPLVGLTHNQTSTTSAVASRLQHLVVMRSRENSMQYDFRTQFRYRVEPYSGTEASSEPASQAPTSWSTAEAQGRVRAVIPDHLTADAVPAVDPDDPATQPVDSLDDIPLYSVDALADPGRLLREVEREFEGEIGRISGSSRRVMEEFFSEKAQRSNFPLMRSGGHVSPTLFDAAGAAVGVFRVSAEVRDFRPTHVSIKVMMENYLLRGVRTDGSVSVANALDIGGQVELKFTADRSRDHSDSSSDLNGNTQFHYDYSAIDHRALGSGSTSSLAHSLKSANPHFLVDADLRYAVTLVRPGEADRVHDLGWSRNSVQMRVQSKQLAQGIPDGPVRYLPPEASHLRYLGMSSTAHKVTGTGELFERARRWLSDNGYLPAEGRTPGKAGREAQLENFRRFAVLGSDLGLRAGVDEMIDGGHSTWLDKPTASGVERVELRLGATRGRTAPTFLRTVENVQIINWSNTTMTGAESHGHQGVHTGGVAAGIGGPLGTRRLHGTLSPFDLAGDISAEDSAAANNGLIYEQALLSGSAQRMDVFHIPLSFSLDLHTASSLVPAIRFADAPLWQSTDFAEARPWQNGGMELWLPEQRTSGIDRGPAPGLPPVTAELTDEAGLRALRADWVTLPHSATVDALAGSAALYRTFQDAVAGRFDGVRPGEQPAPTDEAVRGRWWQFAHGQAPELAGSSIQQFGRGALAPAKLIANGQQILHGKYVVEHLAASGILTDTNISIELEAFIDKPELLTNEEFAETDHGGFPAYIETDVYAPDATARTRTTASGVQGGLSGELAGMISIRRGDASVSYRNRHIYRKGKASATTDSTDTQVNRVSAEDDRMFRFGADLHYVLRVRRGTRNAVMNLAGLGSFPDTVVKVTVPKAAQFVLTGHQVRQQVNSLGGDARRLLATPGALPRLGAARYLPERFRAGDGIGHGASVSDAYAANGRRAHFLDQILRTVQEQTPGVLRPGHGAYVPGLESRLADFASPIGMRGLAGRGARGHQTLHYVYQHAAGAELVEISLTAAPDVSALGSVVGHDLSTGAGADNGAETYAAHGGGDVSTSDNISWTTGGAHHLGIDYPGSSGSVLAATHAVQRTSSHTIGLTLEDRTSLRAAKGSEFDVPYMYRVDLRRAAMDGAVSGLLNRLGPGLVHEYEKLRTFFRPAPAASRTSLTMVKLRFASTECPPAEVLRTPVDTAELAVPRYAPPPALSDRLAPTVLLEDPAVLGSPGHLLLDMDAGGVQTRQQPDRLGFTLHHDFAVHTYSAIDQLHSALGDVAPRMFPAGSRLWNSEENGAKQLTELIRRGTAIFRNERGEFGLSSGPKHQTGLTISARLSGMRTLGADGMHVDRMRNSSTLLSTSGSITTTPDLGFSQNAHDDVGTSATLLERSRVLHGPATVMTANRRDVVKNENGPRSSSLEVRADLVLELTGPEGAQRWVTGTVHLRVLDLDVLGRGLLDAVHNDVFFDLASIHRQLGLAPDVRELNPVVLDAVTGLISPTAENGAVHLWLDLTHLNWPGEAHAMFVAAHAARTANRPVELSLRGPDGVRHILLDSRGLLHQASDPVARREWQTLTHPEHAWQVRERRTIESAEAAIARLAEQIEQTRRSVQTTRDQWEKLREKTATAGISYDAVPELAELEHEIGRLEETRADLERGIRSEERKLTRFRAGQILDTVPQRLFNLAQRAHDGGALHETVTTTISTLPALSGQYSQHHPFTGLRRRPKRIPPRIRGDGA
jgi:hypothetical protein